jgi:hypothetical protein
MQLLCFSLCLWKASLPGSGKKLDVNNTALLVKKALMLGLAR